MNFYLASQNNLLNYPHTLPVRILAKRENHIGNVSYGIYTFLNFRKRWAGIKYAWVAKPQKHFLGPSIDEWHKPNLTASLIEVSLIDAQSI